MIRWGWREMGETVYFIKWPLGLVDFFQVWAYMTIIKREITIR